MKLKESSLVPLYRQVFDAIKSRIEGGAYQQGDKIPSEAELSSEFSVSRVTVRHAIEELVKEGYLQPRQGKGTFVMQHADASKMRLRCMSKDRLCDIESADMAMSKRLADRRMVKASEKDQAFLASGDSVACVTIVHEKDQVPLVAEQTLLPYDTFSFVLDEAAFDTSVLSLVEKRSGLNPASCSEHALEIVPANNELAITLDIDLGDAVLCERACVIDQYGKPFCIVKRFFSGFQCLIELS